LQCKSLKENTLRSFVTVLYNTSLFNKIILIMRKIFVLLIAATVSLASCSKDEVLDDLNHKEVKAEHLENSTWTVKHAKVHNVKYGDKDATNAQKTFVEGLLKVSIKKIALQKDHNMYIEYDNNKIAGKWQATSNKSKWIIFLDANNNNFPKFKMAELEIRNTRLYLTFNNFNYNHENKEYGIGVLDLELAPHE